MPSVSPRPGFTRHIIKSGKADLDEVEHVRETLWTHARVIYGAFDYWAALYSKAVDAMSEPTVYDISFPSFLHFCRCVKIPHPQDLPAYELEVIWATVNAEDTDAEGLDQFNKARHLNRQEFLQIIVRCAIARYVRSGKIADPSDAIDYLCYEHLEQLVPAECHQNSNVFRKTYCYIPNIDPVIRRHMDTLRSLYTRYADSAPTDLMDRLASKKYLSIGEWLRFLQDVGLSGSEAKEAKQERFHGLSPAKPHVLQ